MSELEQLLKRIDRVSPEEFKHRVKESPQSLRKATFIPPDLDSNHWGYFEVKRSADQRNRHSLVLQA